MELRHIKYFLTLAEEGSFTRAAQKLLIAQPPLSRQIKDLEDELGTELFARSQKGVKLTPAGEKFRQYALQIEQLANQSVEVMQEMNSGLQGTLYLTTVEGQAPHLISAWIAGFHRLYPHVEFNLWNGNSDDAISRLQNGLCDLAVIAGPYNQENLTGIKVYEEPWVAMIPKGHPILKDIEMNVLAGGNADEIDLNALAPYELIIPSRHSRLQEITDWFTDKTVKPRVICQVAHMLNAYELTEQRVGIAIYPAAVGAYANRDEVIIKKLVNPSVWASYYLTRNNEKDLTLVANEFWKYVEENFKEI